VVIIPYNLLRASGLRGHSVATALFHMYLQLERPTLGPTSSGGLQDQVSGGKHTPVGIIHTLGTGSDIQCVFTPTREPVVPHCQHDSQDSLALF